MKHSENKNRKEVAINMLNNHEHTSYHTLKYLHADIYKTLSNNISSDCKTITLSLRKYIFKLRHLHFPVGFTTIRTIKIYSSIKN